MEKKHLIQLDFLRGIAMLLVFLFHSQQVLYPQSFTFRYNSNHILQIQTWHDFILHVLPSTYGFSGVQLFLIISGFVIHYQYLMSDKKFNFAMFINRRFWRIYPPYLVMLIFFCAAGNKITDYIFTPIGLKLLLTHLFMVHNLSDKSFFMINGSWWSLALEFQLYLLYPLLLLSRKKIGIKLVFIISVLLSIITIIIGIVIPNLGNSAAYSYSAPAFWFTWISGAYLAELYVNKKPLFKNNIIYVVSSLGVLFFSGLLSFAHQFIFVISTIAWLIFTDYILNHIRLAGKSIISKFLIFSGICSYSFYLLHEPFLSSLFNKLNIVPEYSELRFLNTLLPFIILLFISYSCYLLIELNSIKMGKNFFIKFFKSDSGKALKSLNAANNF